MCVNYHLILKCENIKNFNAEIKNFIHIYLQTVFDEQNNDKGDIFYMVLESQEFFFAGRYLKTEIDHSYGWMNEINETNLHFR